MRAVPVACALQALNVDRRWALPAQGTGPGSQVLAHSRTFLNGRTVSTKECRSSVLWVATSTGWL